MNALLRSISSEWRKNTATKTWWILAIVILAYAAMMAAPFGFMFGEFMGEAGNAPSIETSRLGAMIYSTASTFGYTIPLVLGALAATNELRHGTLGVTFTIEPRRTVVLVGKLIVLLVVGAFIGIAGYAGSIGAGAPLLAYGDIPTGLASATTWALIGRGIAALALWAVIGFGIGLIVKNQAFAIVLAIVFTQFIEPVLRIAAGLWEWTATVGKFLPGAAMDAFVGQSIFNDLAVMDPGGAQLQTSTPLTMPQGFAVLLAYAVVACVIGWLMRLRADVE